MNKGKVIVISGPSGVGKGTIINQMLSHDSGLNVAVSASTRAPREGEIDGVSYHFMSQENFDQYVKDDQFIEWCHVHGNCYGTLKNEVEKYTNSGQSVILEIDTEGARKVRERVTDLVSIFISPPTLSELKKRLVNRRTEPESIVNKRLSKAKDEMQRVGEYDFVVVNKDIKEATTDTLSIIAKIKGDQ